MPGTPKCLARLGTLWLKETPAAHLRPVPHSPPSAGLYFWDAQEAEPGEGADPGEGAVRGLRGPPRETEGYVFLPGVPAPGLFQTLQI